ncbi:MAG: hypothetical protein Q8896_10825, partial [Bacteroidota bacterium]|nr:hypothetical protein [Bacteroidota bacterium]
MNPINGLKSLFLILLLSSIAFGQSDGIKWIRYGGGGVFSFSPDGRKLVTGGGLGNLIVWDLDKRKPQTIFNMPNKGSLSNIRCSFSSGGDSLLVSNGEMDIVFYYWDIVKSEIVGRTQVTIPYPYYGNVTCSGKQFAITSNNNSVGTIYIGNSDIGITDSLVGHESGVLGALFFHSGDRLASWSNDGTIRIWDVTSQKELVRIHHNQTEIAGVAISDSANCICAFCSDSTLRAYDLSDGSLKYIFPSKFSFYTRVILNPSASSTHGALYTWDTDPLWDSMITIIDLKDGSIIKKIQGINCRVGDATFSPSDSQMSVFLVNGALMLYDGNTWKITDSLSGESQSVSSLLYSRKSNEILCGGDSHDILYLNSEDGRLSHAMRNIAWG